MQAIYRIALSTLRQQQSVANKVNAHTAFMHALSDRLPISRAWTELRIAGGTGEHMGTVRISDLVSRPGFSDGNSRQRVVGEILARRHSRWSQAVQVCVCDLHRLQATF